MSKKGPAHHYKSYEVITQLDEATGDTIIPLPPQLLKQLGWKEGDEIDFQLDDTGKIVVTKKSK